MAKLSPVVSTLAGVPADFHDAYVERDGAWHVDVELPADPRDAEIRALKDECVSTRHAIRALKDAIGSASPEDVWKIMAGAQEPPAEDTARAARLAALEAEHAAALKPALDRATLYRQQRDRLLVENTAATAILAQRGAVKLLGPIVTGQLRVTETDVGPVVEALDDAGAVIPVDKLVAKLSRSSEYARAFAPEPPPAQRGNGAAEKLDAKAMSASARLAAIRAGKLPAH